MIWSQSLKFGDLEGLGIGAKILKLHVNNFRGPLYPEAKENAFFRNVGKFLPEYTASHPVAVKSPLACGKETDRPQHLYTLLLNTTDKMEQGIRQLIIINSNCQENTKISQI
jgi:hypothetical protein